ncbi:hypothetical protein CK510_09305 [Brunnivagina elsteri CCALA 953]|uniref:DUF962 domain-containing protein n=2 Tax=Brunnivagina TaxID=3344733 RepID=A0A2A2TKS4_9CYAN|nr:hypothetical protein CK510_09305 [Calothrix elsteri CCALA 953]
MHLTNQNPKNSINSEILDYPFTDYWDIFIIKHQHPINIALHILGILFFYSLLLTSWILNNPWLLIALPLTQTVGLLGHLLFERSHVDIQDAVFSLRASRCLGLMLLRTLQGKYRQDIHQRLEILHQYQAQKEMHN